MGLEGKGFFIWKIRECDGGDPQAIAAAAQNASLTHVLIKVANGIYAYNYDWERRIDLVPPLAQALKARGIQVWGWHYMFGDSPVAEARKAIQRVQELSLDGYVLDAEAPFKQPGKREAARRFMQELRSGLPNYPVALTSYRYPSYHPQFPWREFLEKCDLNMPQVYWQSSHNPGIQLTRSVREFQDLVPYRPIIPIGSAYRSGSWVPTTDDMIEFLQTAQAINLPAANFWEWSAARKDSLIQLWNTIAEYDWGGGLIPGDIAERYIAALNTRDPAQVAALYLPTAAHVTATRTIAGVEAIRAWYQSLLDTILPGGSFTLTGFSGTGNSRHFTWTATSTLGRVENGNDVFGLLDGKIVYHYSSFSVS